MPSYGGSPICPRCDKAVYAAEQIMGPGRKTYHKPCLTCTTCRTRLDSFKLVEHNFEPYCKPCHVKNFGTIDLRNANLPTKVVIPSVNSTTLKAYATNAMLSRRSTSSDGELNNSFDSLELNNDDSRSQSPTSPVQPETLVGSAYVRSTSPIRANAPWKRATSPVRSFSTDSAPVRPPLSPASTGSSYSFNSPTRWKPNAGGAICPTCQKQVYFAEQVKASGRTWHKNCLRCTECKTALSPGRLTDKEGVVLCHNCYSKLHGPQGSGYALLRRAG